jgi:hypothetical protein
MIARRGFVVALGAIVVLAALGIYGVVSGPIGRPRIRQPEGIDREKLRADIAAKRARGESIATKTLQELEWEREEPGVEFVVRGDALSGVVDLEQETPSGPRHLAKLGGMGSHRLQIQPEAGNHTFTIRMGNGSRSFTVPVEARQLTRVVVMLKAQRSEKKSFRTTITYYDAEVIVEPPHPAGPAR